MQQQQPRMNSAEEQRTLDPGDSSPKFRTTSNTVAHMVRTRYYALAGLTEPLGEGCGSAARKWSCGEDEEVPVDNTHVCNVSAMVLASRRWSPNVVGVLVRRFPFHRCCVARRAGTASGGWRVATTKEDERRRSRQVQGAQGGSTTQHTTSWTQIHVLHAHSSTSVSDGGRSPGRLIYSSRWGMTLLSPLHQRQQGT